MNGKMGERLKVSYKSLICIRYMQFIILALNMVVNNENLEDESDNDVTDQHGTEGYLK